jgi:nitroreductase
MDLLKAIMERRSVRSFKADPIPEDMLQRLVEAGIWAPSGGNAQTWCFIIVTDSGSIRRLKMLSPGLLGNPPAVIVICQNVAEAERKGAKLGKEVLMLMDSAMAAQNIMLAAYAEGLGTCIVRSFHPGGIQKLLRLPEYIEPQILISVGVTASVSKPPKRNFDIVSFQEYRGND